jgi:geranylgeranyl pyrophosphate synthase
MGLAASRAYAASLRDDALAALDALPQLATQRLREIAFRVVARDN